MLFVKLFLVCMTIGLSAADEAISRSWEEIDLPDSSNYKLVKVTVNGTVKDVQDGYILNLGKPEFNQGKIWLEFRIGNRLTGSIVKQGKDVDGDLYSLEDWSSTKMAIFGKPQEDEELVFPLVYNLKRVKFSDDFNELTIGAPSSTLLFKRKVFEKKSH